MRADIETPTQRIVEPSYNETERTPGKKERLVPYVKVDNTVRQKKTGAP